MSFEEEFPTLSKRWDEEAPYEIGEDLKQAFRDTVIDKQRVREAIDKHDFCLSGPCKHGEDKYDYCFWVFKRDLRL